MSDGKRFTGDTYRCPDTPFFIRDNGKIVLSFKHDELPYGYNSLNKILDLLNSLDDEIVLLKSDVSALSNPDVEYVYNVGKLELVRRECEDKYVGEIKDLKRCKRELERKYDVLSGEYESVVELNDKFKEYILNPENKLL